MRFEGTLKKWDEARGFGFITPDQGEQDLFVHISEFPRGGPPPRPGERLSFAVKTREDGKKKAVQVLRPDSAAPRPTRQPAPPRPARPHASGRRWWKGAVLALALVGGAGAWWTQRPQQPITSSLTPSASPHAPAVEPPGVTAPAPETASFRCDGRTQCSQMTSCAEATFFLRNCPGTEMDGDNDGTPCEKQWCISPLAR